MFFSIDGVDGAGKSTQISLFIEWLRGLGKEVVSCRDPGSTSLGESLRQILLHSRDLPICTRAEMLIYMASRAQLVEEIIKPALHAGKTVVSDRFLLANVVYQGHAAGGNIDEIWSVGRVAVQDVMPNLTFVLDIDPKIGLGRMKRETDRLESRGLEYLERVRQGFLHEAKQHEARQHNNRMIVIDANRSREEVQADIRLAAQIALAGQNSGGAIQ